MGVDIRPAPSRAAKQAARAGVPTGAAAIAALRRTRGVGASAFASAPPGDPVASLHTITERYPTTRRVHTGVPYAAWVLTGRGTLPEVSGYVGAGNPSASASSPPPANNCHVVAIYSLALKDWTEIFGHCSASSSVAP